MDKTIVRNFTRVGTWDGTEGRITFNTSYTRVGNGNRRWKSLLGQQNITNPVVINSGRYDVFSLPYAKIRLTATGSVFEGDYSIWNNATTWAMPGLPPGSMMTDLINKHSPRFFKELRETRTQIQSGVFLGELRETMRFIRRPFSSALQATLFYAKRQEANYLRRFRRLPDGRVVLRERGISAAALAKLSARTYLEYTYAMRPLLKDMSDGAVALARLTNEPKVHAIRRTDYSKALASGTSPQSFPRGTFNWVWQDIMTCQIRSVCGVRVRPEPQTTNAKIGKALEVFGFTFESFVPTVWELLPTSFITDMFVNVGDILSSYTTCLDDVVWSSVTKRSWTRRVTRFSGVKASAGYTLLGSSDGIQISEKFNMVRQVGLEYPTLSFGLPGSKSGFSLAVILAACSPFKRR